MPTPTKIINTTAPKDLSQPEINWLTWGFEGVTHFAAKIERTNNEEALIIINGQGCKTTTCVMIDDLEIRLPHNAVQSETANIDLTQLVEAGDLAGVK